MNRICLSIDNVHIKAGDEVLLENVNLELQGPGLVVVIGPNGAGKTTLFKTITGLVKPARGRIRFCGTDVTGNPRMAGRLIGYMPQLSEVNRSFPVTGWELVESSVVFRMRPPRLRAPREVVERIQRIIEEVGALDYASKPLSELSGGQVQRLLLARAVAAGTPVLLLDEPTSAVDPRGRLGVVSYIKELAREKLVLLSTHDPTLFRDAASLIVVMWKGVKAVGPPREVLRPDTLREVYGDMVIPVKECVHLVDGHAV